MKPAGISIITLLRLFVLDASYAASVSGTSRDRAVEDISYTEYLPVALESHFTTCPISSSDERTQTPSVSGLYGEPSIS